MRDIDIRSNIKDSLLYKYYHDGESRVVEEMTLPVAKARIDMAVINGHLHGFEIKSASDTLQRLPSQLIAYSKVFDYLSVVTEEKYHKKVLDILPDWVGLYVCSTKNGECKIKQIKSGTLNKSKEGFFIAKLLWRDELIKVLLENNIPFKMKDRNWILAEILSANISLNNLSKTVRAILKKRDTWKTTDTIKYYEEK